MSDCPDDEAIANLGAGALNDDERARLLAHLDTCDACRAIVADAARASETDADADAPAPRRPGATLGRYVILETVGAGAMGVVHAAYDPELGRKVALKVLRTDPFAKGSSSAQRGRLLREAQSLAKLSHPNVVTLHDVGTLDGEVFLAMEFVEEGTLGDWLRAARRPWRAVVTLLRQAGEGLAAAHAAGLVHRDFKPENVLVGAEGRARVTDFGLARDQSTAAEDGRDAARAGPAGDAKLTLTGALIGTPAYMAPEVLSGGVADARSDQWSFAATLYEALYGDRAFAGTDVASLAAAIARGDVRPPPAGSRVPAWVRRAVVRGLRVHPRERFASMRAFVDALGKGPLLSPVRVAAGLVACAALALVAVAALRRPAGDAPACTDDEGAWGGVFGAADEAAVHRAFTATGLPTAESLFAQVARELVAYREGWTAMHHEACEATRVRHTQSEAMLDMRMVCLESRREEVAALVSVYASADDDTVASSQAAFDALRSVAGCAETQQLIAQGPPARESAERAELAREDAEVMRALALHEAYKWSECIDVIAALLPTARALSSAVEARAIYARGLCEMHVAPRTEAVSSLHGAARFAMMRHDPATLADAWVALVEAYSLTGSPDDAEEYGRYAQVAIAQLGGDDDREAARLEHLAETVHAFRAVPDEGEGYAARARNLLTRAHGPDDYRVATAEALLAEALADDHMPDAIAIDVRVLATRERVFGTESEVALAARIEHAEHLNLAGHPEQAIVVYRGALARRPSIEAGTAGAVQTALARALRHAGSFAEARDVDRAAEDRAGEGLDELGLGRARAAVPLLEEAVSRSAAFGDGTGEARFGLGRALWDSGGDRKRAREQALAARARIADRAGRYGGRFAAEASAIDAWLASHP